MNHIETISHGDEVFALIVYSYQATKPIDFFTQDSASLQVGKHARKAGEVIKGHKHLPVKVERFETLQEVLYLENGKMKVNFYTDEGRWFKSKVFKKGDLILIIKGGHDFEFLEETQMIEVKQGPYNPASKVILDIKEDE